MTVCIASICAWGGGQIIVGAADRLVTYGDIEYEQPDPKIWQLASHTIVMTSGSPEDHAIIADRTLARIRTMGVTNPTVGFIANIYAEEFANLRRERAARKYLAPQGLSIYTFLNSQTNLTSATANRLQELMEDARLNSRAIVAGLDGAVASIYVIADPGEAALLNMVGWAAIGNGSRHADAQFIAEKYSPTWGFEDAILLTYLAKKRADVTPGVGPHTDVFWISTTEGYVRLPDDLPIVQQLAKLHSDLMDNDKHERAKSKEKMREFVRQGLEKQQQAQGGQQSAIQAVTTTATPNTGDITVDAAGIRGGASEGEQAR